MKINFVAQKQNRLEDGNSGPLVIVSRKAYNVDGGFFSYYQQVTQYHSQRGGECTTGEWYEISKSEYDDELGLEIKWDNHP